LFGWSYGLALIGLAAAWMATSWIGYAAMRAGRMALHRRWMTRAFVLTFAFVIYRAFTDVARAMDVGTFETRNIAAAWVCWSIPLALTIFGEGIADLRKKRVVE